MVKLFSNFIWMRFPTSFQKLGSFFFSRFFYLKFSRFIILPYCFVMGLDRDYLEQFEPEGSQKQYRSYSDFFQRKYKIHPQISAPYIWPCEGYICDWGFFAKKSDSVVKGQKFDLNAVFGSSPEQTKSHFFVNIFLHNHNYHRIHSPTSAVISKIQNIPGDLVFLRPWFYPRGSVSYPAFRNERVNIEMRDKNNSLWMISLVGGFGVGTIQLSRDLAVGKTIHIGDEIGLFNLGSTVCMATPFEIQIQEYLQTVKFNQELKRSGGLVES